VVAELKKKKKENNDQLFIFVLVLNQQNSSRERIEKSNIKISVNHNTLLTFIFNQK
jgi:hypothetical protein